MECKSYMKNDGFPGNDEIFVFGLKHNNTDKVVIYILIGCESDEIYENDKVFNLWSNKFMNKKIEKRGFKITGGSFKPMVRRNNFFGIQSIVCS